MIITFCGHSDVSDETTVRKWLYEVLKQLIKTGGTQFYLGGYGAFDYMAKDVVTTLQKNILILKQY